MDTDAWSGLPDVEFDESAAMSLQAAAESTAQGVAERVRAISNSSREALQEFKGHFADVFRDNVATATVDGQNIALCLKTLAQYTGELLSAAQQENKQRAHAREWIESRKALNKMTPGDTRDPLSQGPMPYVIDEIGPSYATEDVALKERPRPKRGAGGGGGGTTSANPANLRSFSTGEFSAFGTLDAGNAIGPDGPTALRNALVDFQDTCHWGKLESSSIVAMTQRWLEANEADKQWVGAIAAAFESAGGKGSVSQVSTLPNASLDAALAGAGIRAIREGLDVKPPTLQGVVPTTGYANDPVNTATGNFIEPEVDIAFAGVSETLQLTRMYNSVDEGTGAFGLGWSSLLDIRLLLGNEIATFVMNDGRHLEFPRSGSAWGRAVDANYWLAEPDHEVLPTDLVPSDSQLVVRDNEGSWWAFSASGICLGYGVGSGTTVTLTRDAEGRIVLLQHEHGRSLEVEYHNGMVTAIRSSDGRRIGYEYDEVGRLSDVSREEGNRSYRWNDADLIDQVTNADGVIECVNIYDNRRRVTEQLTPFGRRIRYVYLPGRVTAISDMDGEHANTWIADRRGRLIGVIDAEDQRQSMAYDPHGNLVSVTERDGAITVHAYDERGRRTRTLTPEKSDTSYAYDHHDRLSTITTSGGTATTFEYAASADRLPYRITDPLGGSTQLGWDRGLLQHLTDPTGVRLNLRYDERGELIASTDAAGNTTRLNRDSAGRITEVVLPSGSSTKYHYEHGHLVRREDADGALWSYERSGSQITAIVDPYGARTEYRYGPHGEVVQVIDPLGRVTEQCFTEMGNLDRIVLADGAEWSFCHDGLSRLNEVIDSDGGSWLREYDSVGAVSAVVDPTGVREEIVRARTDGVDTVRTAFAETTTRYDHYGRPVRVTGSDGGETVTTYDACGRVAEVLDAEGGLTEITRDLAGRPVAVRSPASRELRFEYDACGRPAALIDGTGARTELRYNEDSRVIARVLPNGDVAEIEYDALGRVVRERTPGQGVARRRFDLAGRLVWAQDTKYGTRRFRYDRAGQLVCAINGLGGETHYSYDALGRVIRIADPAGGSTTREYTSLNRVAAVTDPLGRTTTARYDAAGRQVEQTDPEGRTLAWCFDEAGRLRSINVNGRPLARIDHTSGFGEEIVTDFTRGDGEPVVHRFRWDRLGRLCERSRGSEVTRWCYDADGLRTSMETPSGARVEYAHDAAGRMTRIAHSAFGVISYDYDAAGNLVSSRSGDALQVWAYGDGFPIEYIRTDTAGARATRIARDDDGRIVSVAGPDETVRYEYDAACQLVCSVTGTGELHTWAYDVAGRIARETSPGGRTAFVYDAAGQLLAMQPEQGDETVFEYDGLGRRVRMTSTDARTEYAWDDHGWLATVQTSDGSDETRHELWADALGELAEIDGSQVQWDTASEYPSLTGIGAASVFAAPGGFTGAGNEWHSAGWRPARGNTTLDPWGLLPIPGFEDAPSAVQADMTLSGGLQVAGLEWMGARAYDPTTMGFLSVDPLEAIPGAAWSGNPYSFAGNDPVHALDPLGLRPVTDRELVDLYDRYTGNWGQFSRWAATDAGSEISSMLSSWSSILAAAARIAAPTGIGFLVLQVASAVAGAGSILIDIAAKHGVGLEREASTRTFETPSASKGNGGAPGVLGLATAKLGEAAISPLLQNGHSPRPAGAISFGGFESRAGALIGPEV